MNTVKILALLLTAAVLSCAFLGCGGKDGAVEEVRQQLESLPTVEQFRAMDEAAQLDAYNKTQAAYDAYMALTEQQKQQLSEAESTFEALFSYFNNQIMPLE